MKLRTDIETFPYQNRTRETGYLLINWEDRIQKVYSTVAEKHDLVLDLKRIIEKNKQDNYMLNGLWHGKYRTDLFPLDLKHALLQLQNEF